MQRAEAFTYDPVHDAQRVYRALVDALARPGKVNSIQEVCATFPAFASGHQGLLACGFALLDREVSFAVAAPDDEARRLTEVLRLETFGVPASSKEADYVFIDPVGTDAAGIHQLVTQFKRGTLANPHASATVFLLVDAFSEANGLQLTLRGPGIADERTLFVSGLAYDWIAAREEANVEYPLGVDIVLVSKSGEIVGLPRTTVIQTSSAAKESATKEV